MHVYSKQKTLFLMLICSLAAKTSLATPLIPLEAVEPLLSAYSDKEKTLIKEDFANIRNLIFREAKESHQAPVYLATAGAPGSRKSTTLETYLQQEERFHNLAYIDPDTRSLFFMINTYLASDLSYVAISKKPSFAVAKKDAYNKWRAASNYIANSLLNEAFASRKSIAHGTTLTGPHVDKLLETLKTAGYRIELILCTAPEAARKQILEYRNAVQGNYQSTPEDAVTKAYLFPERVPVYFKHAHKLYLHFSSSLTDDFSVAAEIDVAAKKMVVKDQDRYEKFVEEYKTSAKKDAAFVPWTELIRNYSLEKSKA